MISKLLRVSFVFVVTALYMSGCGAVQIPPDIAIPTGLPPIAGTLAPDPSQPTQAPANNEPAAPGADDETSGESVLLYGLLAVFVVITLFAAVVLLGKPGGNPGPDA